jgi:hypothetical protein
MSKRRLNDVKPSRLILYRCCDRRHIRICGYRWYSRRISANLIRCFCGTVRRIPHLWAADIIALMGVGAWRECGRVPSPTDFKEVSNRLFFVVNKHTSLSTAITHLTLK